jgi:hypothetical protein
MKLNPFLKFLVQTLSLRSFRLAHAASALTLTLGTAQAGAPASPTAPAEEVPLSNWIGFTVGGAFVSGDDAGMSQRTQTNGDFYGGIDSFQFSKALNDKTTLTLDGHALPGLEDYEFNLNLEKTDVGFVKAGYKEYRTWYDGSGGYNPYGTAANRWVMPSDEELSLDRGEIYVEAGLRLPNIPNVTFGYQHLWRNGTKDSTIWGRTNIANVPSFYDIDETRDIFKLDIEHTLGNTDIDLGLRYETSDNDNTRYEKRQRLGTATDRNVTQRDVLDTDLFNAHLFTETRLGERVMLNFGYSFTTMDTDNDGSDRVFNNVTSNRDEGYIDLFGGSQVKTHVANASLWWNPIDDLVIAPSFRVEWEDISSRARYNLIALSAVNPLDEDIISSNDNELTTTSEQLEIRYTGISNMLLYARGQWSQVDGDRFVWEDVDGDLSSRLTDTSVETQKYVVGANWYPMQGLSLSSQYYYQSYDEDFNHRDGGLTPMMRNHSFDTNDVNIRLTWRALPNLTFVSRYDYQQTNIDNTAFDPDLNKIQSADVTSNIFSQSATWNVTQRFYLQGSVHWIQSDTNTGYDGYIQDNRVPNMDNDYFAGSLTSGFAIDDKTNLVGSLTYYGASNYAAASSAMGYGLNTEEYGASLTLNRMITPNMIWNLRYAFITSNTDEMPDQTGGYNDFDAHMISTGLQIRF